MSEIKPGSVRVICTTLPLEVKALPCGDDKWIILFSGVSDLSSIPKETVEVLTQWAIERAKIALRTGGELTNADHS